MEPSPEVRQNTTEGSDQFGAVAVNSRFTRSGCRADPGSGLVVLTRFDLVAPSIPAARMSRPV